MKRYLNQQELNNFLLIGVLLDTAAKVREDWMERGNMTKEEHRELKTAETNLKKYYESVLTRLDLSEVEKIAKRSSKFELRILDEYQLKKLNRDTLDKMVNAIVPREQFENWCRDIMQIHCKGCSKNFAECELHTYFEDNFVPESDWALNNCRYAYKELEGSIKQEKIKQYQAFKKKRSGA